MSDEIRTRFEESAAEPDWSDRTAVIEYIVEGERPAVARSRPFDEAAKRELAGRVFDRALNIASSMRNHWLIDGGDRWERLGEVSAPTLVLHGTEDPLFPFAHGQALAKEIPGARLVRMERTGHEAPPRHTWDVVVPAILDHSRRRGAAPGL